MLNILLCNTHHDISNNCNENEQAAYEWEVEETNEKQREDYLTQN